MSMDDETGIVKTNFLTGPNLTIAPVENDIQAIGSLHEGYYENENQLAPYVRYVKNTPGAATFNTVLYPTTATESVSLSTKNIATDLEEYEASSFFFTVTNDKTEAKKEVYYYNLHDKEKKVQRVFGKYETNEILSLAQKGEGKYEYAVLKDGFCWNFEIGKNFYSRKLLFDDNTERELGNMERPFILFENGQPICTYFAVSDSTDGLGFHTCKNTWNMALSIKK